MNDKIKELEKKLEEIQSELNELKQQEDLKPGDVCECGFSQNQYQLKYYCGEKCGEKRFSKHKENINYPEHGVPADSYKKINTYKTKLIEGYMATSKDGDTYMYEDFPKKLKTKYRDEKDSYIHYIGENINGQTFDDEPVKVAIVEL